MKVVLVAPYVPRICSSRVLATVSNLYPASALDHPGICRHLRFTRQPLAEPMHRDSRRYGPAKYAGDDPSQNTPHGVSQGNSCLVALSWTARYLVGDSVDSETRPNGAGELLRAGLSSAGRFEPVVTVV